MGSSLERSSAIPAFFRIWFVLGRNCATPDTVSEFHSPKINALPERT